MLKLDINLLWTVVNVLVMYAVLRKFLFKPVQDVIAKRQQICLLYTSPSPRDGLLSRMPSSA